jgi:GT2 family glycosyltransferase
MLRRTLLGVACLRREQAFGHRPIRRRPAYTQQTTVLVTSFSVVIPLYNKRPHIERAIESVIAQTEAPAEVLVIDDASTDGGVDRLASYRNERLLVLRRPEPGPGGYAARNLGILHARSEWIAFLDADDAWMPDHLATIRKTIARDRHPARIACAFAGYSNIFPDGRSQPDRYSAYIGRSRSKPLDFMGLLTAWLDLRECPIWTSASAFRRQALIDAGLFPSGRCGRGGDKDLWLRVARNGLCAAAPRATAIYHRDATNMVTRKNSTDARHCLCETIVAMLPTAPEAVRPLLKKLFNQEVYQYALYAAKSRKVSPASWRGFYARQDPVRFLVLAGLSTRAGAYAARRLGAALHRHKSETPQYSN